MKQTKIQRKTAMKNRTKPAVFSHAKQPTPLRLVKTRLRRGTVTHNSQLTTRKPLVSVIIPVYNGAKYLEEAVLSVINNTYQNIEVLLVDDGSTDHSKEICRMLDKRYKKVRFFCFPKNRGMDYALNLALKNARGTYICRLNQDDRMLPHRIATQVAFLNRNKDVVAVGSSIRLFDQYGRSELVNFLEEDHEIKSIWYFLSPFSDPAVMYRKHTALDAGGYDQAFWPADDVHLWYRLGLLGKLANIMEPLVEVRWHSDAGSVKHFRTQIKRTYKLHMWTNRHIGSAPWYVHLFWFGELAAGMIFSPEINWGVYRVIKRFVNHLEINRRDRKISTILRTVPAVITQPSKLSASGR